MENKIVLSDLIYETEIFPFLNYKDLLYSVRGVCTDWLNSMKSVWETQMKKELINKIGKMITPRSLEIFTDIYKVKFQGIFEYRQLLLEHETNSHNYYFIEKLLINYPDNQEIKKLIKLFFKVVDGLIENSDNLIETDINNVIEYIINHNNRILYKERIIVLLDITYFDKDLNSLKQLKNEIDQNLDKDVLENIDEITKTLYNFIIGFLDYQIMKHEVRELKEKIEQCFIKMNENCLGDLNNNNNNIYEKVNKLIQNTTTVSNDIVVKVNDIFKKCKVRTVYEDYLLESLKSMYYFIKENKNNDDLYEHIIYKRNILNQKSKMILNINEIFNEFKIFDNKTEENIVHLDDNETIFLKDFLLIIKIIYNVYDNKEVNSDNNNDNTFNIDKELIMNTYKLLYKSSNDYSINDFFNVIIPNENEIINMSEEQKLKLELHKELFYSFRLNEKITMNFIESFQKIIHFKMALIKDMKKYNESIAGALELQTAKKYFETHNKKDKKIRIRVEQSNDNSSNNINNSNDNIDNSDYSDII
jgi:hypothetical protein